MDSIIQEISINNITQRDEESLDENEDDYCVNENIDEEATILTMYKGRDRTVWSKSSFNSLKAHKSVGNIVCVQGGATIVLIPQQMFLKNFWVRILC